MKRTAGVRARSAGCHGYRCGGVASIHLSRLLAEVAPGYVLRAGAPTVARAAAEAGVAAVSLLVARPDDVLDTIRVDTGLEVEPLSRAEWEALLADGETRVLAGRAARTDGQGGPGWCPGRADADWEQAVAREFDLAGRLDGSAVVVVVLVDQGDAYAVHLRDSTKQTDSVQLAPGVRIDADVLSRARYSYPEPALDAQAGRVLALRAVQPAFIASLRERLETSGVRVHFSLLDMDGGKAGWHPVASTHVASERSSERRPGAGVLPLVQLRSAPTQDPDESSSK